MNMFTVVFSCFLQLFFVPPDSGLDEDVAQLMWKIDSITEHRWQIRFDADSETIIATSVEKIPEEPWALTEPDGAEESKGRKSRSLELKISIATPPTDAMKDEYLRAKEDLDQAMRAAPAHIQFYLGMCKTGFKPLDKLDFRTVVQINRLQSKVQRLLPPRYVFGSLLLRAPEEPSGFDFDSEVVEQLQKDIQEIYTILEPLEK
jgi:hypothetical protein